MLALEVPMGVRIKLAATPGEIWSLMEVRHQVFVEEHGYLRSQGGVIVDIYDSLPTTANLIAVADGDVCGGVRITVDSEAGMPSDSFFDFHGVLPADSRMASCSMLCVQRTKRASGRLMVGMFGMAVYWASARGLTHLCAPMNPAVAPMVERIGFVAVGEPFTDPKGLPTLPMVLDMSRLAPAFVDFVQRQDVGLWMDSFERGFFERDQPVVVEGEAGDEAYLVLDGSVVALARGADVGGPTTQRFGPGDVFGELALLTDRPRSATVVATEPTDVMVLRRDQFERQVVSNPDLAMALMRSIGNRFHDTVVGSVDQASS